MTPAMSTAMHPATHTAARIQAFFDAATHTVSYLLSDPHTQRAAVIDPVLDFDYPSGRTATDSARRILQALRGQGLTLDWILETHAHADHLSAADWLKKRTGAKTAIGEHICAVQQHFAQAFNLDDVSGTGREFDRLLKDGDILHIGNLTVDVLHTPGHTPACVSYRVTAHRTKTQQDAGTDGTSTAAPAGDFVDAVFVGDTLFMPDCGTARADFPGGDARTLYRSIQRLLAFPPQTRLFMCHDYKTLARNTYAWESTVAQQRAHNLHIHDGITEAAFVALRQQRDATLPAPTLGDALTGLLALARETLASAPAFIECLSRPDRNVRLLSQVEMSG